jgi:phage gpG-like protein
MAADWEAVLYEAVVDPAMEQLGRAIAFDAAAIALVRTGALKASVYFQLVDHEAHIGATAPYARYNEFGTSKWAGRPFLRPAIYRPRGDVR